MTQLESFARRKIADVLEKYRIDDDNLLQELIETAWAIRSFQVGTPDRKPAQHPALVMCRELTGRPVPDILSGEIVALWEETPDEKLWRQAWADWNRGGRNFAWTWTKWPRTKTQPRYVGPRGGPAADPFATLTVGD